MKQIMSKLLKTSLVAAGLMGVVTLNAWWCDDCQMEHRGPICHVSGKTAAGIDPTTFPLVGHMPSGIPIYGPMKHWEWPGNNFGFKTAEGKWVYELLGKWVYTVDTDMYNLFMGEEGDFYGVHIDNPQSTKMQQAGTLANGKPVYIMPECLKRYETYKDYFYFAVIWTNDDGYFSITEVKMVHDHFVYNNYKHYHTENHSGGAYFDGKQWIDEKTGKIYNTEQDIPPEYKRGGW
ncbi:MAG: hypothetical protein LBE99_03585 [Puniceicoccales bacterium]|jgi:hypothetical protein|nr:hypothetical protein [Puniceicoccales bacterium]